MKNLKSIFIAVGLGTMMAASAFAQGTAFTYQGQLNSGANPANGSYDMAFTLYATNVTGTAIAGPVTNSAVAVTNGLFTTLVNFTNGFGGGSNWLQVAVSTNGANLFGALLPRQQLTPVPYAVFASSVSGLTIQPNATSPNVILGFSGNNVQSGFSGATIGGGGEAGFPNSVTGSFGTVSGGFSNSAAGYAWVGGGEYNIADNSGAVGGGSQNHAAMFAAVGGGNQNDASGTGAFIGGGGYDGNNFAGNTASGNASVVGGGLGNQATSFYATVPGGANNVAGGQYSFAAGQQAQANNQGAFVWADSQNAVFASTANDQFLIRARGGVGIGTASPAKQLDVTGNAIGVAGGSSIDPSVFVRLNNTATDGNTSSPDYAGIGFGHNSTRQAIVGGTFGNDFLDFYTGGSLTAPKMRIDINGTVGIMTNNVLELGYGVAGKEANAGKIGYEKFSGDSLDIVGAGTNTASRKIKFWAEGGATFSGSVTATGFSGPGAGLTGVALLGSANIFTTDQTIQGQVIAAGSFAALTMQNRANSAQNWQWRADATGLNVFSPSLSQPFTINPNGNVGINTTTPTTERLVVAGGADFTTAAASPNTDSGLGLSFESYGGRVQSFQSKPLVLNPIGNNVCIGTTNQMGELTIGTGNGQLSIVGGPFTPELWSTGGGVPGHMRFRNALEIWPNTNITAAGYLDVRGTNGTQNIILDGSDGNITCVAVNVTSDRNAKKDFTPLDPRDVLAKVVSLPITEWQYKQQADSRHIGPMAQDFHDAFTLSQDDKHISVVDEGGVALAAIQGLNQKLDETRAENAELKQTVNDLKNLVEQMKARLGSRQGE